MHETTKKRDCETDHLCITRRNNLYRAGTSHCSFDRDYVRSGIGGTSASFVCILEGTGFYRRRETGEDFPFQPGTMILKEPDCLFDQHHTQGVYIDKYTVFPSRIYDFFIEETGFPRRMILQSPGVDTNVCRKFDDLINELRFQSEKRLPVTILKFCAFASGLLLPEPADVSSYKKGLEKAIRILDADFSRKITIEELAETAGMSKTNFRRIFRKSYRVSPGEYRLRKKMEAIREYMSTNRVTMKELAQRFGYTDAFAFSHQFKQYAGISPKEFYLRHRI